VRNLKGGARMAHAQTERAPGASPGVDGGPVELPETIGVRKVRMIDVPEVVARRVGAAHRSAHNDAQAALVSLGVIAEMLHAARMDHETIWRAFGVSLGERSDRITIKNMVPDAENHAALMRFVRESLSGVLERLGDWHSDRDGVSSVQQATSEPVYRVMHLLAAGVDTDDFPLHDEDAYLVAVGLRDGGGGS
jgi:hypothetical protein